MDMLDSRCLRYTDCFAQKFAAPGRFRYHVTHAAGAWLPVEERAFTINVKERGKARGKGRQHNVGIRREGKGLLAVTAQLEIEAGDMVLWNTADPAVPGFVVSGEGANIAFNSAALNSEAVYTHAFGTPGEFRWVDANGSKLSGVVRVRPIERADKDGFQKWVATLKQGSLVTISGEKATPEEVEILVGQTVFWAVEKASGITITDVRLVPGLAPTRPLRS